MILFKSDTLVLCHKIRLWRQQLIVLCHTRQRPGTELPIGVEGCSCHFNTLRPRQDGCQFPDDIFKFIFLKENEWILPRISLKFVPKVRINNIPALVQIMAWRRPGDKPLSEPMTVCLLTHIYIYIYIYICVTRPQWVNSHEDEAVCTTTFPNANLNIGPISQIPQCIKQISHTAPFCNRNVHCGICAVGLMNVTTSCWVGD